MSARRPHILFDSQLVVDIKPSHNFPDVSKVVGDLYAYLHGHAFIPAEKYTGDQVISKVDPETGSVELHLTGSSLGSPLLHIQPSIKVILPFGLVGYTGSLDIQEVFGAVPGTVVEDGGNVQNMLLNTLTLASALERDYEAFSAHNLGITVISSGDPFRRVPDPLADIFRERISLFPLGVEDRCAIHLQYERHSRLGTLQIASDPKLTATPLRQLLRENEQVAKAFGNATCFVSSDPLFELIPSHAVPPYSIVVNASTAFRALVALHAYSTCALLPMNDGEAGEVCRLMLSRATGTELSETPAPRFPSPFTLKGDDIDTKSLRILDTSLDTFTKFNPPFRPVQGIGVRLPDQLRPRGRIDSRYRRPRRCMFQFDLVGGRRTVSPGGIWISSHRDNVRGRRWRCGCCGKHAFQHRFTGTNR